MNVSQKCQYALRCLFELSKRQGQGPVPISEVAQAQAIPPRFLELILAELKHAGWVDSRRGVSGGYVLAASADELSVGDVIRLMDGPLSPVKCMSAQKDSDCPLRGDCAFIGVWRRAAEAVTNVYDSTTLQDLVREGAAACAMANYCI